jgi:hypothetical protein
MPDLSYATDAGLLIAAVTAGASCASVIQRYKGVRTRRQPELQASLLPIIGGPGEKGSTSMVVLNGGEGVAQDATCVIAVDDSDYVAHPLGSGFLVHGQRVVVKTGIQPHNNIRAIVVCRGLDRRILVWNLKGDHRSYDGNRFDPQRDFQVFWSDFYKEDLSLLRRNSSEVSEMG